MTNSSNDHTVLSNVAVVMCRALESYGLDGPAVLQEAGIDYEAAVDPDSRIPVLRANHLWELAVERTEDPCFGITVGQMMQPAALHGLGLSWLTSTSLKTAFQRLVRFQRLIATDFGLEFLETPDRYVIRERPQPDVIDYEPAACDAFLATAVNLCRVTLNERVNPVRVTVQHARNGCRARYRDFFRCEMEFDALDDRLEFDRHVLDKVSPVANPRLARINDQAVVDYLAMYDASDIVTQVRKKIIDGLIDGRPHQEAVARSLNLSLRNLQRKLSARGTSFRALTEEVRKDLASRYLREKNKSIGEISFLLGFADPANFGRSFKRWTGETPGTFRDHGAHL